MCWSGCDGSSKEQIWLNGWRFQVSKQNMVNILHLPATQINPLKVDPTSVQYVKNSKPIVHDYFQVLTFGTSPPLSNSWQTLSKNRRRRSNHRWIWRAKSYKLDTCIPSIFLIKIKLLPQYYLIGVIHLFKICETKIWNSRKAAWSFRELMRYFASFFNQKLCNVYTVISCHDAQSDKAKSEKIWRTKAGTDQRHKIWKWDVTSTNCNQMAA